MQTAGLDTIVANSHKTLNLGLTAFVGDSKSGVFGLDFIAEITPSKEWKVSVIILTRTFPDRDVAHGSALRAPSVFIVHMPGMNYALSYMFASFLCMACFSFVSKTWGPASLLWIFLTEQCRSFGVVGFDIPSTRHLPLLTVTRTSLSDWGPGLYGQGFIQAAQPSGNFLKVCWAAL